MSAPNQSMGGGGGDNAALKISSEIVVVAIIFFFMLVASAFFFYVYVNRRFRSALLARSHASFAFAPADRGPVPVPGGGLDAAVLRSLPVTVYRAADFKEGIECSVCLSEMADGEAARVLPKCGHGFHLDCIDMWFHSHSNCPLCRSPVGTSPSADPTVAGAGSTQALPSETVLEPPVVPTNALLSATATAADGAGTQEGPSCSSCSSTWRKPPDGEVLVIEIPRSTVAMEETTSPVSARFRSLRRLWSQGRRTADIEQGLEGCGEGMGEGSSTNASRKHQMVSGEL